MALKPLLDAVDEAYGSFDADRCLGERAMEISSRELNDRNRELTERNAQVHAAHAQLQAAHDGLRRLAEELEARVAQRTAELTSLNHQLIEDIEERRKVEEMLRESEERYGARGPGGQGRPLGLGPADRKGVLLGTLEGDAGTGRAGGR